MLVQDYAHKEGRNLQFRDIGWSSFDQKLTSMLYIES